MRTISTQAELNSAGPDIDAAILQFMREQASKRKGQPCVPSLALIALAVLRETGRKTSPFVVRKRLKELGVEEEVDTGVEARKQENHPQTSTAGLNGQDRGFLRSCGILTEEWAELKVVGPTTCRLSDKLFIDPKEWTPWYLPHMRHIPMMVTWVTKKFKTKEKDAPAGRDGKFKKDKN